MSAVETAVSFLTALKNIVFIFAPYYKDKKTPCKYCDYKSICGFNMGGCENKYNYIDKKSKQEILEKMRNETVWIKNNNWHIIVIYAIINI